MRFQLQPTSAHSQTLSLDIADYDIVHGSVPGCPVVPHLDRLINDKVDNKEHSERVDLRRRLGESGADPDDFQHSIEDVQLLSKDTSVYDEFVR